MPLRRVCATCRTFFHAPVLSNDDVEVEKCELVSTSTTKLVLQQVRSTASCQRAPGCAGHAPLHACCRSALLAATDARPHSTTSPPALTQGDVVLGTCEGKLYDQLMPSARWHPDAKAALKARRSEAQVLARRGCWGGAAAH